MSARQPDRTGPVLKHLCASLGINTRLGEQGVEVDVEHVTQLIEAGALPADPSDSPAFTQLIARLSEGGAA